MKLIRPTNITTEGSFSRSSAATYFDASGVMQTAAAGEPRFTYDPSTLEFQGLLIETERTNLLLNSSTLSTQTVSVIGSQYTLSFYGSGTITLSDAFTSSLVGTGAFPQRVSLTFTPTAGNLTLTVTGTVEYANLELGATASSWIPTTGTSATRTADVITGTGLIYTDVPENDYAEWNAATNYTLGTRVIRLNTHKIYENTLAGIDSGLPENTPNRWLEVGPTNRWRLFDQIVGTVTEQANSFTYVLKPGRINGLALLGLDAAKVSVALYADNQVVYSGAVDLLSGNTVGDWYEYFYEPIYQQENVAITSLFDTALLNLPAYGESVLTVRVEYPAQTAKLGVLVVGLSSDLGLTQYDASIGIIDYSVKEPDEFGNTVVVERPYSKRMNADTVVKNVVVDNVARILALYRATPLVWVGTENVFNSMVVYGFCRDWEIVLREPTVSTLRLDIEGLT